MSGGLGKKMGIYIAASFPRREEAVALKHRLESHDFHITSGWLNGTYPLYGNGNNQDMEKFSQMDLQDVTDAHCIVQMTDGDKQTTKGGRHTELGFALAQNKKVFLLGPREQVFHYHPYVSCVPNTVNEWTVDNPTTSEKPDIDMLVAMLVGYRRQEMPHV